MELKGSLISRKLPTQSWSADKIHSDITIPALKDIVGMNFRCEGGTWTQGSTTGSLADSNEGVCRIVKQITILDNRGREIYKLRGQDLPHIYMYQTGRKITKTDPTLTPSATSTPRFEVFIAMSIKADLQPVKYRLEWGDIDDVDPTGYSGTTASFTMYPTVIYGNATVNKGISYEDVTTVNGDNLDDIQKYGRLTGLITINSADTILTDIKIEHRNYFKINSKFKDLITIMDLHLNAGISRYTGDMFYYFEPFVIDDTSKLNYTATSSETMRKIFFYDITDVTYIYGKTKAGAVAVKRLPRRSILRRR